MSRIIFKTKNDLAFVPDGDASPGEFLSKHEALAGINMLNSPGYQGAINNLFSTLDRFQLESLVKRVTESEKTYLAPNLFSYYSFVCNEHIDPVETLKELHESDCIEWAYMENNNAIDPYHGTQRKPLASYQGYLYDAPLGVGVSYAWRKKGGRGDSSVQFVDIEQGWMFDHESLNLQRIPHTGINNEAFSDHGAAVMGVIMMRDGGSGGIGITPLVKGSVMSIYRPDGILNVPDAIVSALHYLEAGDILLIESQVLDSDNGYQLLPLEVREANFDAIRLATAMGITVIEPCGNGNIHSSSGNDLDNYRNSKEQRILNRTDQGFKDSGAIMVAAATSQVPHQRMHFTNYGNRIDCYAWGENIVTAGLHPHSSGIAINTYTNQFGGTSGAAAIIAGVAISLQSMLDANYHCRLFPTQMRNILGSFFYGTASAEGLLKDRIGVMPDLNKITTDYIKNFTSLENVIPNKRINIGRPLVSGGSD